MRSSVLGNALAAFLFLVVTAALGVGFARAAPDIPGAMWVLAGPLALLVGFVMLVCTGAMIGSFFASMKTTNWLAHVAEGEVFLNLRSYRNAHFDDADDTILSLPLSEVASMHRLDERWTSRAQGRSKSATTSKHRYIVLDLGDTSTEALSTALANERVREAPITKMAGVEGRSKFRHEPVQVERPGSIRIEWSNHLWSALAPQVEAGEPVVTNLNAALEDYTPEERAEALVKRGQPMQARSVLRQDLGLSGKEAEAQVDAMERSAA